MLYKADNRQCIDCMIESSLINNPSELKRVPIPEIKNNSFKIFSEESAYQMTSFLMGVIEEYGKKYK